VAKGHLILVEGEEGVGKGYFAVWCLVQLAKGHWGPKTAGLYLSTEEEPDVIQERLLAAGWDPEVDAPIHILRVNNGDSMALMPLDYAAMVALVRQWRYGLVVVDVLRDHCAPTEDMGIRQRSNNDETWIRPAAGAWERLAAVTGAGVLGLHHRNKSETGSARAKSTGSGAWRQRARLVIVLVEVSGDRALAVDKQNIGRRVEGIWPYDLKVVTEDYGRFELGTFDDRYAGIDAWEKAMRKLADVDFEFNPAAVVEQWCEQTLPAGEIDLRLPRQDELAGLVHLSRRKLKDAMDELKGRDLLFYRREGNIQVTYYHRNGHTP
jgi:RecA-family ATPase